MAQEPQEERRLTELPPVTSGGKVHTGLFVLQLVDLLDAGPSKYQEEDGTIKQRVRLKWQVEEVIDCDVPEPDELIGQLWSQYCNYTMAQRSTLLGIATTILQRTIPDGTAPRPLDLIGGFVKMTIAEQMGRNGKMEIVWSPQVYRGQAPQAPQPAQQRGYTGEAHAFNGNPSTPKQAASGNQEPTPRQLKFLQATADALGLTDADLDAQSMQMFGMRVEALNRRDLSGLIEWIQAENEPAGVS
jgi:hypothetical protein